MGEVIERIAVDANAAIDLLREDRVTPPPLIGTQQVALPLPVLGELYLGAYSSQRQAENLAAIKQLLSKWIVLELDAETARIYGGIRSRYHDQQTPTPARLNDLWIAAACIRYDIALLTKDGGFDSIPNLTVVHW